MIYMYKQHAPFNMDEKAEKGPRNNKTFIDKTTPLIDFFNVRLRGKKGQRHVCAAHLCYN